MLKKLADEGADEEGFNHLASVDDAAEALDFAVKAAREEKDKTVTPSTEKNEKSKEGKGKIMAVIIVASCLAGLAIIIFVVILVKKRRKKNEK
jgi:hypothetical protein